MPIIFKEQIFFFKQKSYMKIQWKKVIKAVLLWFELGKGQALCPDPHLLRAIISLRCFLHTARLSTSSSFVSPLPSVLPPITVFIKAADMG